MTDIEAYLKRLEELSDKATPGPWLKEPWYNYIWSGEGESTRLVKAIISLRAQHIPNQFYKEDERANNSNFIAESRQAIPVLLKLICLYKAALESIADDNCYCDPNPEKGFGPCARCISKQAIAYSPWDEK